MVVTLLYFAALRDLLGTSEESLTLPASVTTVAELRRWLGRERPALGERLEYVRIARNERFAGDDEVLAASDVIALIPPVAGG